MQGGRGHGGRVEAQWGRDTDRGSKLKNLQAADIQDRCRGEQLSEELPFREKLSQGWQEMPAAPGYYLIASRIPPGQGRKHSTASWTQRVRRSELDAASSCAGRG